jgi:hypothetical protein
VKLGTLYIPTAVQAVAEVHDTPLRAELTLPLGLGVAWTAQDVPFHRSASVASLEDPTAVQGVADVQDTPLR